MQSSGYTLSNFQKELESKLRQYIEAQYHIKNDAFVRQRRELLDIKGTLASEVFIETNKVYRKQKGYNQAGLPDYALTLFETLSKEPTLTGIMPTPFSHQLDSIRSFIDERKNLIIATGTGSGKTESFLYPLLANLLSLSKDKSSDGVMKSLILYPMNALVSDQTTRLRKLLGSEYSVNTIKKILGRPLRFANYTGATPSPGAFDRTTNKKVATSLKRLFNIEEGAGTPELTEYRNKLEAENRLPKKKNLYEFLNQLELARSVDSLINLDDPELILRSEVQRLQPDLLVTNFSMLEYMLLRPIEQMIFDNTRDWLKSNRANNFTLVLDEAHIYNGVSGSEVALLIRRLKARLGASDDQFRVIIASASLGENEQTILKNANDLSGLDADSFKIINHELVSFVDQDICDISILKCLDSLNANNISSYKTISSEAREFIDQKLHQIWQLRNISNGKEENLTFSERCYLALSGLDLINQIRSTLLKDPVSFEALENEITQYIQKREFKSSSIINFIEVIINLGSIATAPGSNGSDVLLPIRAHYMFRGLPGIYICVNKNCTAKNALSKTPLGQMYPDKRTICTCGSKVYELYTHRECGTAYIKAFWPEDIFEGTPIHEAVIYPEKGSDNTNKLVSVFFCIDEHNTDNSIGLYLNPRTGQLSTSATQNFLKTSYSPNTEIFNKKTVEMFQGIEDAWIPTSCLCCSMDTVSSSGLSESGETAVQGTLDIKPLGTIGDDPFTYLVKEQFRLQPVSKPELSPDTNQGRKSLIFSDGRQKAARLAKTIPRIIQRDVFRSYLVKAYEWLQTSDAKTTLLDEFELEKLSVAKTLDPEILYYGFLHVCSETKKVFFEGKDRSVFAKHLRQYNAEDKYPISTQSIPSSFFEDLTAIICTHRYNLCDLAIAGIRVNLSKKALRDIDKYGVSREFSEAFFAKRARDFLLSGSINIEHSFISKAFPYPVDYGRGSNYRLSQTRRSKRFRQNQAENVSKDKYKELNEIFVANTLQSINSDEGLYVINLSKLRLEIAIDETWYECQQCLYLTDIILPDGRCPACGTAKSSIKEFDINSDYFTARKLFWRDPIRTALNDISSEMFIEVGEHTAQLNYRDNSDKVVPTVSNNELKFQDILDPREKNNNAIDVLSSTTTMEVGIDIGGLIAVSMRNVPPQRQNYQQRAGRAGRRGSSFSTVVTFCQSGSHDSYYFHHPKSMIAGKMAEIHLDPRRERLVKRHFIASLLAAYFRTIMENSGLGISERADIFSHLGSLEDFLGETEPNLSGFEHWYLHGGKSIANQLTDWYPALQGNMTDDMFLSLMLNLKSSLVEYKDQLDSRGFTDWTNNESQLLEVLMNVSWLPSYAFPTDLVQLEIYDFKGNRPIPIERPQVGISQAIQEFAPGRALVIDKNVYQVAYLLHDSVISNSTNKSRALFKGDKFRNYFVCNSCKTLHISKNTRCCDSKSLRHVEVIQPRYAVPKDLIGSVNGNDIVYTSAEKAQIVINGKVLESKTCKRFSSEHSVFRSEEVRIARLNEGIPREEGKSFLVCDRCGATSPPFDFEGEEDYHMTNYPSWNKEKKQFFRRSRCYGTPRPVAIGFDFQTELTSLKVKLTNHFDLPQGVVMSSALESAAQSAALAMRNAFAIIEDINTTDLGFGARILPDEDEPWLELFFYDDNNGGAGYASVVGNSIFNITKKAEDILTNCSCDSSCYNCLSSFDTRFIDSKLNRHLGLSLLRFIRSNELEIDGDEKLLDSLKKSIEDELNAFGIHMENGQLSLGSKSIELNLQPSLSIPSFSHSHDQAITTPYQLSHELYPTVEKIRSILAK